MELFDKRQALDVIEDALTDLGTAHGRGLATGLCGAFHMCGLISEDEWGNFLDRIPLEPRGGRIENTENGMHKAIVLSKFQQYIKLTDSLIGMADKQELAECARILAVNVAHYELHYGELPLSEKLATIDSDEPNDQQMRMLANGMETLTGVLGKVIQGFEEKINH